MPKKSNNERIDEPVDPVRESMLDGFFDLHELEAFADEEEKYLPDTAFGQEKVDEGSVMESFHERQRRGDVVLNDNEDDDDDDDDGVASFLEDHENPARRKKYRPDDEVQALLTMYNTPQPQSDDDEVANMTAADFFGQPNLKARSRWLKNKQSKREEMKD